MRERGPRLEALLDERDHLRVRLSMAQNGEGGPSDVGEIRHRLLVVDREIVRHWGEKPNS